MHLNYWQEDDDEEDDDEESSEIQAIAVSHLLSIW